jgi:hypothetical protein
VTDRVPGLDVRLPRPGAVQLRAGPGGLAVPMIAVVATATWVWTLPETRDRDLAKL